MTFKELAFKNLGISSSDWNKLYKDYYNRLRTFEAETGAEKRDTSKELYYTLSEQRKGHTLSKQRQAVLSTPAYSSKARQKNIARGSKATQARQLSFGAGVFSGLINSSKIAQNIWNNKDLTPKEKLDLLTKYANDRQKQKTIKQTKTGVKKSRDYDKYGGYDTLAGWSEWE